MARSFESTLRMTALVPLAPFVIRPSSSHAPWSSPQVLPASHPQVPSAVSASSNCAPFRCNSCLDFVRIRRLASAGMACACERVAGRSVPHRGGEQVIAPCHGRRLNLCAPVALYFNSGAARQKRGPTRASLPRGGVCSHDRTLDSALIKRRDLTATAAYVLTPCRKPG